MSILTWTALTFISGCDCVTECSVALCSKLRLSDVRVAKPSIISTASFWRAWAYLSKACSLSSRPIPDCLKPPDGIDNSVWLVQFICQASLHTNAQDEITKQRTHAMPASRVCATRIALSISSVDTDTASPYDVSLACSTTGKLFGVRWSTTRTISPSSVLNFMTHATGPNISSADFHVGLALREIFWVVLSVASAGAILRERENTS